MNDSRALTAAVLNSVGAPVAIDSTLRIDDPGPGEVLVRVAHCGVCHSDVSVMTGEAPLPLPIVLGHEATGVVEEIGAGVTTVAQGDHVLISPVASCGHCYFCARGDYRLCERNISLITQTMPDGTTKLSRDGEPVYQGFGVGGFAEYLMVMESGAIKISKDLPLDVASVIGCAVQTGAGAIFNNAGVEPGDTVLVMGLGGIGVAMVQAARISGASRVIVSDPVPERRELAMTLGGTDAIDPGSVDVVAECHRLTNGIGVDHALDAVGFSSLVQTGFNATRNGGTTVVVGAGPIAETIDISRVALLMSQKKLVGCVLGGGSGQREIPRLIGLWQRGLLDLEAMVTARRPLSEINEAVDDLKAARGLRTVLTP